MSRASAVPEHIVVLLHGIRTEAAWAEMVVDVLQQRPGVLAVPIRYGYFAVQRMMLPFLRKPPVERLLREIRDLRETYPDAKLSVVAHSFGSYAVSRALQEAGIRIRRLILCGSVISRGYRWDQVGHRLEERVINECGTHDIWPVLAGATSFGLGASGTFGFGTARVRDRFHKFSHSDYFDRAFVERYWAPYLWDGEIVGSEWEKVRPKPPGWQSLLALLPIKWLLLAACVALLALGVRAVWPPDSAPGRRPEGLVSEVTDSGGSDMTSSSGGDLASVALTSDLGDQLTSSADAPGVVPPPPALQPNLLENHDFEEHVFSTDRPAEWRAVRWLPRDDVLALSESARSGHWSAHLRADEVNHIRFAQVVAIKPATWYRLSGWIATREVAHSAEPNDRGAHLAIVGLAAGQNPYPAYSDGVFGNSPWIEREVVFFSGDFTRAEVLVELGGFGATTTGEAWFDDLSLVEAPPPPA